MQDNREREREREGEKEKERELRQSGFYTGMVSEETELVFQSHRWPPNCPRSPGIRRLMKAAGVPIPDPRAGRDEDEDSMYEGEEEEEDEFEDDPVLEKEMQEATATVIHPDVKCEEACQPEALVSVEPPQKLRRMDAGGLGSATKEDPRASPSPWSHPRKSHPRKPLKTHNPSHPRKPLKTHNPRHPRKPVENPQCEASRKPLKTRNPSHPRKPLKTRNPSHP